MPSQNCRNISAPDLKNPIYPVDNPVTVFIKSNDVGIVHLLFFILFPVALSLVTLFTAYYCFDNWIYSKQLKHDEELQPLLGRKVEKTDKRRLITRKWKEIEMRNRATRKRKTELRLVQPSGGGWKIWTFVGFLLLAFYNCFDMFYILGLRIGKFWTTGNFQLCKFSYFCPRPFWYLYAFNHTISSLAYTVLGFFLIGSSWKKDRRLKELVGEFPRLIGHQQKYENYIWLDIGCGVAMVFQGLATAGFHLCPNNDHYQYHTSLNYIIMFMACFKLYHLRRPLFYKADISGAVHIAFYFTTAVVLNLEKVWEYLQIQLILHFAISGTILFVALFTYCIGDSKIPDLGIVFTFKTVGLLVIGVFTFVGISPIFPWVYLLYSLITRIPGCRALQGNRGTFFDLMINKLQSLDDMYDSRQRVNEIEFIFQTIIFAMGVIIFALNESISKWYFMSASFTTMQTCRIIFHAISHKFGQTKESIFSIRSIQYYLPLCIVRVVIWTYWIVHGMTLGENFSLLLLTYFLLHLIHFIRRKHQYESRSRAWIQPLVYLVLFLIFLGISVVYYIEGNADSDHSLLLNSAFCPDKEIDSIWNFNLYYDVHDRWHFVSALSYFFMFKMLFTIDDNLLEIDIDKIKVF